jgi:heme exporter protein D
VNTLSEFFHMGGYAVFVWSSYAITLVVMVLNWWLPRIQHRQNLKKLSRLHKSGNSRQERGSNDSRA